MIWTGTLTFPCTDPRVPLMQAANEKHESIKLLVGDRILAARVTKAEELFSHRVKFYLLAMED